MKPDTDALVSIAGWAELSRLGRSSSTSKDLSTLDLAVGGVDLTLKDGFSVLGCSRLIQIKTPDPVPAPNC